MKVSLCDYHAPLKNIILCHAERSEASGFRVVIRFFTSLRFVQNDIFGTFSTEHDYHKQTFDSIVAKIARCKIIFERLFLTDGHIIDNLITDSCIRGSFDLPDVCKIRFTVGCNYFRF
jgi:hypothetical protein